MRFTKHKLGDLLRITRGASLPGTGYADKGRYLRLTLANFHEEGGFKEFKSTQGKYFVEPFDSRFLMHKGDLITPLTEQSPGLLGSVAFIPCDDLYIQSQDVGLITCNAEKLDKTFAYYLFLTRSVREQISARSQQTKIRHTSPDKIADVEVYLPDLPTQLRIAGVLGSLDEKIELNRKKIAELEALAKTIYDYWFVQFNFPDKDDKPYKSSGGKMVWNEQLKREVPEGWEVGNLYDIANFENGLACQRFRPKNGEASLPVIKIREMHDGINSDTERVSANIPAKHRIEDGDLLFSWSASLEAMIWCGGAGGLNQHIFKVTPRGEYSVEYVYRQLASYIVTFAKMAEARKTTMGHITADHIKQSRVVLSSNDTLIRFATSTKPIFERRLTVRKEVRELTEQRDTLLPLLMNGQVTVG